MKPGQLERCIGAGLAKRAELSQIALGVKGEVILVGRALDRVQTKIIAAALEQYELEVAELLEALRIYADDRNWTPSHPDGVVGDRWDWDEDQGVRSDGGTSYPGYRLAEAVLAKLDT